MSRDSKKKCPSCQTFMLGPYCHQCGEKKLSQQDLSMRTLLSHAWESVTEVDGKWLKSFILLISKPGQLTVDYLTGLRRQRLTPFQILVFCNLLFFVVAGLMGYSAFTTPLEVHTQATNFLHQPLAKEWVTHHINASDMTYFEYATAFNDRVEIQAKSLVIIMVPMLTLLVYVLNFKSPAGAVTFWVFATHVFAFMLLLQSTVAPGVEYVLVWLLAALGLVDVSLWFELLYSVILFLLFAMYYHLASGRVFQDRPFVMWIKSFLFMVGVYWIFLIYRMVLFFTTYFSL